MHQTATPPPEPTPTDPPKDRSGRSMPESIVALLSLVSILIGYGRYFAGTARERAGTPQFPTVAAVFGTHEVAVILTRVQRGILRAMALQRYLLIRAARGRDLTRIIPRVIAGMRWLDTGVPPPWEIPSRPTRDRAPAQAAAKPPEAERPAPRKRRRIDPDDLHIPTFAELEAEVRRRPVGRTIAYICQDLGIVPGFCAGGVWSQIYLWLRWYGGSFNVFYEVRKRREATFQKERDRRPATWDWNWRDLRTDTVRQVLGCLVGAAPPMPDTPLLATAPP